jgi:hypothetical protein
VVEAGAGEHREVGVSLGLLRRDDIDEDARHVVPDERWQSVGNGPFAAAGYDAAQASDDRRPPLHAVPAVNLKDAVRGELRCELLEAAAVAGVVVAGESVAHCLTDGELSNLDHRVPLRYYCMPVRQGTIHLNVSSHPVSPYVPSVSFVASPCSNGGL